MITVAKYSFEMKAEFSIQMRRYAKIINVHFDTCEIFAVVDTTEKNMWHKFRIAETGEELKEYDSDWKYLKSISKKNGAEVHIFFRGWE